MSWHFLQEQGAAFWEASSLDGAPSALLKLMPMRAVCYSLGNVTACCLDSPSGTMCEPSMAAAGEARSTWLREGSRARTSAQQDVAPGSKASNPASGWKWPASFVRYDRSARSWRTRQCSLLGDSAAYSETWPRWGSMRDGECLELPTPARPTYGSGSGLWPTPKASAAGPDFAKLDRSKTGISLQTAVAMYPTPRSTDGERGGRGDLIQAVRGNPNSHYKTWPTPHGFSKDGRSNGPRGNELGRAVN